MTFPATWFSAAGGFDVDGVVDSTFAGEDEEDDGEDEEELDADAGGAESGAES
jgi:hypothetical protein